MKSKTQILKEESHIILMVFLSCISVIFLLVSGLGFLYYKIEVLVGILNIIIGFILGLSIIFFCIKEQINMSKE